MASTHTVVKGDTLWSIAEKYLGSGSKYTQLASIYDIPNPDLIYVGQVIKLSADATSDTKSSSTTQATINQFGIQSNSDRVIFATWGWDNDNTEHYEVEWCYDTGDGVWFIGSKNNTEDKQSTYNIPTNAERIRFRVKPVSKKYTSNDKEVSYWTASWSTVKTFSTTNLPPTTPGTISVDIEKYTLTASIENVDASKIHATGIQFQVVKDNSTVFSTGKVTINTTTNVATYSCTVTAGSEYKVRARSYKGSLYSDWTDYTNNVRAIPAAPSGITECSATSKTSVYLEWSAVTAAKTYDIEYATKKDYFDRTDQTTKKTGIEFTKYELIGLETGQEYFFRVRAVNEKGESAWTSIKSVVIGKDPAAPTTWSSTTTVVTGEELVLYWVHNSEDNSSQTYAELEITVNNKVTTYTIENSTDEEKKDLTSFYKVNTSTYIEGTIFKWRVRTAGITKVYGDWSIQRTVDIYAPPTLDLRVTNRTGSQFEVLESFPFKVYALAGPNTQTPIGYNLTITSNSVYETVDRLGEPKTVNQGEAVYSEYFDIRDSLDIQLSAGDVDLENNISYTITCVVSMNSGLTATSSVVFSVAWIDEYFSPNAEISIDKDTLTAYIKPYCEIKYVHRYKVNRLYNLYTKSSEEIGSVYGTAVKNSFTDTGEQVYYGTTADGVSLYYCEVLEGVLVEDTTVAVYRREFDGTFTELASGIDNMSNTTITDPHPSLDFARYRIVATTNSTGAVSYYDMPGIPVGEHAIVIQWDEAWRNFDVTNDDVMEEPTWSGSILRLPYNVDVSDKYDPDVVHVEYAGRKHPVSYYGTHIGETSTWNTDIDKSDKETLHALRRLATWMGDVYVREPSGSGYWANVKVSFSQTHRELVIPVILDITRVEGGV